eukprot:g7760.t1
MVAIPVHPADGIQQSPRGAHLPPGANISSLSSMAPPPSTSITIGATAEQNFLPLKQADLPVVAIKGPLRIGDVAVAGAPCTVQLGTVQPLGLSQLRFYGSSVPQLSPGTGIREHFFCWINGDSSTIDGAELTQERLLFVYAMGPTMEAQWLALQMPDRETAVEWLAAFRVCRNQNGAVQPGQIESSFPPVGGGEIRAVATSPTLTRVPAGVVPASAPAMASSSPRVYTDRASALQAAEEVRLELTRKMTSIPRFVQPQSAGVVTVSGAGGTTSSLGPSASAAGGVVPGSSHSNYEFFQGSKPVPSAEVSSRTTTNNGDDVLLAGDDAVHENMGIAGSKEPPTFEQDWLPIGAAGVFVESSLMPPGSPGDDNTPSAPRGSHSATPAQSSVILQDGIPHNLPRRTIQATTTPRTLSLNTSTPAAELGPSIPSSAPASMTARPILSGNRTPTLGSRTPTLGLKMNEERDDEEAAEEQPPQQPLQTNSRPTSSELSRYKQEVERLTRIWNQSLDEVAMHAKKIETLRVEKAKCEKEFAVVSEKLQKAQVETAELRIANYELKTQGKDVEFDFGKELERLNAELARARQEAASFAQELEFERATLKANFEAETTALKEQHATEISHLRNELEAKYGECRELYGDLESEREQYRRFVEQHNPTSNTVLYSLRVEMDKLKDANNRMESDKATTFKEMEELSTQRNTHLGIINQLVQMFVTARFPPGSERETLAREEAIRVARKIGDTCKDHSHCSLMPPNHNAYQTTFLPASTRLQEAREVLAASPTPETTTRPPPPAVDMRQNKKALEVVQLETPELIGGSEQTGGPLLSCRRRVFSKR